jgi:hypothetical protein
MNLKQTFYAKEVKCHSSTYISMTPCARYTRAKNRLYIYVGVPGLSGSKMYTGHNGYHIGRKVDKYKLFSARWTTRIQQERSDSATTWASRAYPTAVNVRGEMAIIPMHLHPDVPCVCECMYVPFRQGIVDVSVDPSIYTTGKTGATVVKYFVVCPGGPKHGRGILCRVPGHPDTRQRIGHGRGDRRYTANKWPRWRGQKTHGEELYTAEESTDTRQRLHTR